MREEETKYIGHVTQFESELLLKYLRNETTTEESCEVERWMKGDDKKQKELTQTARLFYVRRAHDRMSARNPVKAFHKVEAQIQRRDRRRKATPILYAVASVVGAIIISFFSLLWQQKSNFFMSDVWLRANPGVRARVTLPDGSIAELNSGSRIGYSPSFGWTDRTVQLNGEALFRVKRQDKKPFTVSSIDGRSKVKVLGTTFNVQSFNDEADFTTTLIEGAVSVYSVRSDGSTVLNRLFQNDKLTFNRMTDSLTITMTDPEVETAWTQDKIVFNRTKMYDVIKRLVYNYNVEFEVKNPAIYQYEFTGTFDNLQLQQVLDYLKITSRIQYTIIYPEAGRGEQQRTKVILQQ